MPPLPPSWDGYHPLVVHFPVALLVVAPLFLVIAGLTGKRAFMISTLLLLVLGVAGAFVATNTGEAAFDVIEPDEAMELLDPDYLYYDVADEHGEQAEFARNVFTGATVLYALVTLVGFLKPSTRNLKPRLVTHLVTLAVLAWGNAIMANAAHLGGELVHRYGVRAVLAEPEAESEESEDGEPEADEPDTGESDADDPAAPEDEEAVTAA